MPSLKDLTCSIELSDKQTPLQEFGTTYGDGVVETFVPVPSKPHSFSIHLSSNKFIAPGIAMYVFIDGIYQCNRNRQDLKLRKPKDGLSLVDFRVRQKEERQKDGSMIAREWTFEKLNTSANDAPDLCPPNILDSIGCIEVIVLRCTGARNAKSVSNMNLDGVGDMPDPHFGLNGQSDKKSIFDDRLPFFSGRSIHGPSSSSWYRLPYTETVHNREAKTIHSRRNTQNRREVPPSSPLSNRHRTGSKYSEPISPRTRSKSSISFSGVQYGSGPIPRDESSKDHTPSSLSSSTIPIVDPAWLDKLVTTAVKRGVEEAHRNETLSEKPIEHRSIMADVETASHLPGAWPMSPFSTPTQIMSSESDTPNPDEGCGTTWDKSQSYWEQPPARSRADTRVTWNEELVWDNSSQAEGWASLEDNNIDSWDTDETWAPKKSKVKKTASRRSRSRANTVCNKRSVSPVTIPTRRSRSRISHPRSSMLQAELRSSSEDEKDWAHVEHASSSDGSREISDDIIRPEQSRSQATNSRSRSKMRAPSRHSERPHTSSHHSDRTHHTSSHYTEPDRKSTHHTHQGPVRNVTSATPPNTSINIPTVYSVPPSIHPTEVPSRKTSIHTESAISIAPPPSWGCAVPEITRKHSMATTYMPPTPYGTTLDELVKSIKGDEKDGSRSVSSSSWEIGKKDGELKGSVKVASDKSSSWSTGGKGSNKKDVWGDDGEKKSDAAKGSWGDGESKKNDSNRDVTKSSWNDSIDKKTDLSGSNNYGWSKTVADEKDKNGWEVPNNDQNDGWTMSSDQKATKTNGWSTNNDSWETQSTLNDKPLKPLSNLSPAPLQATPSPPTTAWQTIPWALKPPPSSIPPPSTTTKPITKTPPPPHSPIPSPHWTFPPPPPISEQTPTLSSLPAEPLHKISQQTANRKRVKHQVLAGKGTPYGHVVGRPEYIDGLDKPYAVFRFKYRARDVIQDMFGGEALSPSGRGGRGRDGREKGNERGSGGMGNVAREWTERWVEGQMKRVEE